MANNATVCNLLDYLTIVFNDTGGSENSFHTITLTTCFITITVLSPVAVVGNALILAAIWKKTFQRTYFHVLLSWLAITDLCTGLIFQPSTAALYLYAILQSRAATTLTALSTFSNAYLISLSLLIMTLLSVERWLHMSQSRRSCLTWRRGWFTAILVFFTPIPIAVFHSVKTTTTCELDPEWLGLEIATITWTIICFLTTCVAYINVFRIIRCHRQHIQASAQSQNFGRPAINLAKYEKSVRTTIYILALFCSCFLPYIIAYGTYLKVGINTVTIMVFSMSMVLLFLSSSLNPCLYLWRMNDIRTGVKQLFCTNTQNINHAP